MGASPAVAFASILFVVGGAITIPVPGLGQSIWIPGYIAIAAVVYAGLVSALTFTIGNPLVEKVASKNESEAQFRYELTRVRENAESIALIKGDTDEKKRLGSTFEGLLKRWLEVITQHTRLTWLLNSNSFFAPVVPLLLATPKYLSGEMTLGAMMQVAAAFTSVLGALNWFTDNYIRLAEWSASAKRVDELYVALELVSIDDHEPVIRRGRELLGGKLEHEPALLRLRRPRLVRQVDEQVDAKLVAELGDRSMLALVADRGRTRKDAVGAVDDGQVGHADLAVTADRGSQITGWLVPPGQQADETPGCGLAVMAEADDVAVATHAAS